MAVTLSLPRFCTIQYQQNPYLGVPENPLVNMPSGFMTFQQDQIFSPRTKFELEPSETGDATVVNIRSCYNNKYWELTDEQLGVISASAVKPQEDHYKSGCTLFRVEQASQGQVYFFSIGENRYVYAFETGTKPSPYGLALSYQHATAGLAIVDWETLVILPPHVSFKHEGDYLCSRSIEGAPHLKFESGLAAEDPLVAHDLSPANDGSYHIKSVHFGQSWSTGPQNWVLADGLQQDGRFSLYSFLKVSDGVFAFRNEGTHENFCGRFTSGTITDCLNAAYQTVQGEAMLTVEERVVQRTISQLQYRLSDSRIYQEEIQELAQDLTTNFSPDKETTLTLTYTASDSKTTNWTNSISLASRVKVNFEPTSVPVIENGEVKLSEASQEYEWGVTETTEGTSWPATHTVTVPPSTTVKVTLMCTKATCDVPFSYTETVLLLSGETVTTTNDDGIFTGIYTSDLRFESSVQGKND